MATEPLSTLIGVLSTDTHSYAHLSNATFSDTTVSPDGSRGLSTQLIDPTALDQLFVQRPPRKNASLCEGDALHLHHSTVSIMPTAQTNVAGKMMTLSYDACCYCCCVFKLGHGHGHHSQELCKSNQPVYSIPPNDGKPAARPPAALPCLMFKFVYVDWLVYRA